ncbi:MAG: hypothetical protein ACRD2H_08270 [Terriglobales bacterium]
MKRIVPLAALAAFIVGAIGCSRQAQPAAAFNGTWQLDTTASQGVPAMMRGHSTVMQLTARRNTFTIAFVFDGNPMNISKFTLDEREHVLPLGPTNGQASGRVLQGGRAVALEIRRPAQSGATPIEHIVFTLEPDGQTIRRVRTVPGDKAPPQVYIYRRITG